MTLASASPRREQLFRLLGLPFVVRPVDIAEIPGEGEPPWDLVVRLAMEKALAVRTERGFDLVVGSDTVVTVPKGDVTVPKGDVTVPRGNTHTVLGKPRDRAETAAMMRLLGGREHSVYTGVAIVDVSSGLRAWGAVRVGVKLRRLDDSAIEAYCDSGIGDDKAGAYAVQDREFGVVESVTGCAAAAMGLPVCLVRRVLADLGASVPTDAALAEGCSALTGLACCLGDGRPGPEVVVYGTEGR